MANSSRGGGDFLKPEVATISAEPLIEASGINLKIRGNTILQEVSLTVASREIVTLIGPNGAGKSTLVKIILGLIRSDGGLVRIRAGTRIGYVPQHLVVEETLPLTVQRFITLGIRARRQQVQAVLEETGAVHVLKRPIQMVSGGELRRVMLARALLRQPDLLVLDEPVQAVDISGQYEMYDLLSRIRTIRGCGVLMVSHDLHLVMATTDRVICLNHHVCCAGKPENVSRHPAYLRLFGYEGTQHLAVYKHHHDSRSNTQIKKVTAIGEDVDG